MVILGNLGAGSTKASAYTNCGAVGNYFKGFLEDPSKRTFEVSGASTYLYPQVGSVCDSDPDKSSSNKLVTDWEMLTGNAYADNPHNYGHGYAQAGFFKYYNSCAYVFGEWNPDGSSLNGHVNRHVYTELGCLTYGAQYAFRTLYTQSCTCLVNSFNGASLNQTNFNPYDASRVNNWPQPFGVQFNAEARYQENLIPGNNANRALWSAMGVQRADNLSVVDIPCFLNSGVTPDKTTGQLAAYSCNSFATWN